MTLPSNIAEEVMRIVDREWYGARPAPSEFGTPDRVEHVLYLRPLGEIAPFWRVWTGQRSWGVRPQSDLDQAWLKVAAEMSSR